jgi:hypothetical protein
MATATKPPPRLPLGAKGTFRSDHPIGRGHVRYGRRPGSWTTTRSGMDDDREPRGRWPGKAAESDGFVPERPSRGDLRPG